MARADDTRELVQSAVERQRKQREVAQTGKLPDKAGDEGIEKADSDKVGM